MNFRTFGHLLITRPAHHLHIPPLLLHNRRLQELALLDSVQVNVLINSHAVELLAVLAELDKLLDAALGQVRTEVALELLHDDGLSLLTAETVAKRSLNGNLVEDGAVVELDGQGVGDGTEGGLVVVGSVLGVLDALHLLAQGLNQLRGGSLATIGVVGSLEAAEDEHDGAHVLDAVVTVGEVVHGLELLVDDADASLVRAAGDGLDVGGRLAHGLELVVDLLRGLDGGLGVELGRVGDLEQDVLHDVAAIGTLELELLALEEDVVETPGGSRQDGRDTLLALHDLESQVDGTLASVTGSPRLAGHGVGGVAVGSQTLAINPGLGDSVGNLLLAEAEHLGDDGGGRDLDEDNVVQANLVVGVEKSQATLDLVRLDHTLKDILDGEDLAASQVTAGLVGAVDPVSDGEDGAQVVRRVTPLGGEPAVVEVEPSDHGADVEGTVNGVQDKGSTGDLGTVGNDGAGDNRSQELGALLEPQTLKTAADGIEEDPSSSVELAKPKLVTFVIFLCHECVLSYDGGRDSRWNAGAQFELGWGNIF